MAVRRYAWKLKLIAAFASGWRVLDLAQGGGNATTVALPRATTATVALLLCYHCGTGPVGLTEVGTHTDHEQRMAKYKLVSWCSKDDVKQCYLEDLWELLSKSLVVLVQVRVQVIVESQIRPHC